MLYRMLGCNFTHFYLSIPTAPLIATRWSCYIIIHLLLSYFYLVFLFLNENLWVTWHLTSQPTVILIIQRPFMYTMIQNSNHIVDIFGSWSTMTNVCSGMWAFIFVSYVLEGWIISIGEWSMFTIYIRNVENWK